MRMPGSYLLYSWLGLALSLGACGDKDEADSGAGVNAGDSAGEDGGDTSGEDGGEDDGGEDDGGEDGGTGNGDIYAEVACDLLAGNLESIEAASSESEASQALIVPSETTAWSIQSAGSDSYVMLEVEDWMVTVRLFATEGIGVDIQGVKQTASQAECEACSGYTDQAFEIHDWGSYVIHLQGEGTIELSAIQEATKE